MESIGARIRKRRIEMGLSVDRLADMLGKNRATVYRYESDEIENLPISVIGPLADALNVNPAYLMGWSDSEDPSDPFSDRFRETASSELNAVDSSDMETAIESGFPYQDIMSVIESGDPLSLADACRVALQMGMRVSDLLREDDDDYYSSVSNSCYLNKKIPSLDKSEPGTGKEYEIMRLVRTLSDPQKDFLIAYLETLVGRNQAGSPAAPTPVSGTAPISGSLDQT